ncbi:MAG: RDD family protein [Rickettsiaceae bacterium]|nr:RDD family protein [Rickettsiaceae bacterium]
MKKQILYPKFTTRILALAIDLTVVTIILIPLSWIIMPYIFEASFSRFIMENNLQNINISDINKFILDKDFLQKITAGELINFVVKSEIIRLLCLCVYFTISFTNYGTSIGKRMLNIRIEDYTTGSKITVWQSVNRFFLQWLGLICFPMMIFSKDKRGMHDKIASTIVVKM